MSRGVSNVGMELSARGACPAAAHAAGRRTVPLPASTVMPVEVLEIVEWKRREKHGRSPFSPALAGLVLVATTFTVLGGYGRVNQNLGSFCRHNSYYNSSSREDQNPVS